MKGLDCGLCIVLKGWILDPHWKKFGLDFQIFGFEEISFRFRSSTWGRWRRLRRSWRSCRSWTTRTLSACAPSSSSSTTRNPTAPQSGKLLHYSHLVSLFMLRIRNNSFRIRILPSRSLRIQIQVLLASSLRIRIRLFRSFRIWILLVSSSVPEIFQDLKIFDLKDPARDPDPPLFHTKIRNIFDKFIKKWVNSE